jgi:hypothetical protein
MNNCRLIYNETDSFSITYNPLPYLSILLILEHNDSLSSLLQ